MSQPHRGREDSRMQSTGQWVSEAQGLTPGLGEPPPGAPPRSCVYASVKPQLETHTPPARRSLLTCPQEPGLVPGRGRGALQLGFQL